MYLGLTTLSDKNIDRLMADPPLVYKVISPDDDTDYDRERKGKGLLGKLFGGKKKEPEPLQFEDGEMGTADVDKAWHSIHFALTGTAWEGDPPLNFLLLGGESIGEIDVGYGPARAIRSAEVVNIQKALAQLSDEDILKRLDWKKMQEEEIYPNIWDREDDRKEEEEYIINALASVRGLLDLAVQHRLGLIVYLG